jgi:protein-L-isoaspartate(D-aspartate) O-methyltransferase
MSDFAAARRNMVDGQVRTADVTDLRIQSAMLEIPREKFVPPASAGLAYLDLDLPVGKLGSRRLLKPMVFAKLILALEQDEDLARMAGSALSDQQNVRVVTGPLIAGWPKDALYDVVVLEGATEIAPEAFLGQLRDGGRLVGILGSGPGAKAMLYCRSGHELGGRPIFDATAAVLPGFAKAPVFAF